MELSLKSTAFFLAILLTGLSAGLFYAWEVSVIPGTKRIPDRSYLETMQSINRAILNPGFYLIFFGSLLLMGISSYLQYPGNNSTVFWVILGASLSYLVGTFGVTVLGNVPMNEALDSISLAELSSDDLSQTRGSYEAKWNHFHTIRTIFSVLAFGLMLLALFLDKNISTT